MTPVEVLCVPGELFAHDRRYAVFAAFEEQMDMVGHKDPCMDRTLSPDSIFSEPFEEAGLVPVVFEDRGFVYPPDNDVMQCSGCIEAGFSRHVGILVE